MTRPIHKPSCDLCEPSKLFLYGSDGRKIEVEPSKGFEFWQGVNFEAPAGYDAVSDHDAEHLREAILDPHDETAWPAYLIAWEE